MVERYGGHGCLLHLLRALYGIKVYLILVHFIKMVLHKRDQSLVSQMFIFFF